MQVCTTDQNWPAWSCLFILVVLWVSSCKHVYKNQNHAWKREGKGRDMTRSVSKSVWQAIREKLFDHKIILYNYPDFSSDCFIVVYCSWCRCPCSGGGGLVLVLYRFLVVVVVTLAIVGGVAAANSLGANGIWFVSPLAPSPPPLPSSNECLLQCVYHMHSFKECDAWDRQLASQM